jgi:hypothetical protein
MDLFSLPCQKLSDDGKNWDQYKTAFQAALWCEGLLKYLDGHIKKPLEVTRISDEAIKMPDGTIVTDEDEIERLEAEVDLFVQRDASVKHLIALTISNTLFGRLNIDLSFKFAATPAPKVWDAICKRYDDEESKSGEYQPITAEDSSQRLRHEKKQVSNPKTTPQVSESRGNVGKSKAAKGERMEKMELETNENEWGEGRTNEYAPNSTSSTPSPTAVSAKNTPSSTPLALTILTISNPLRICTHSNEPIVIVPGVDKLSTTLPQVTKSRGRVEKSKAAKEERMEGMALATANGNERRKRRTSEYVDNSMPSTSSPTTMSMRDMPNCAFPAPTSSNPLQACIDVNEPIAIIPRMDGSNTAMPRPAESRATERNEPTSDGEREGEIRMWTCMCMLATTPVTTPCITVPKDETIEGQATVPQTENKWRSTPMSNSKREGEMRTRAHECAPATALATTPGAAVPEGEINKAWATLLRSRIKPSMQSWELADRSNDLKPSMQSRMLADRQDKIETPNAGIEGTDSRFEGGTNKNNSTNARESRDDTLLLYWPRSHHDYPDIGHTLRVSIKANRPEWPIEGEAKRRGNAMTKREVTKSIVELIELISQSDTTLRAVPRHITCKSFQAPSEIQDPTGKNCTIFHSISTVTIMLHFRTSPTTVTTHPKPVRIQGKIDCPNLNCTVNIPHTYQNLKTVPPCPPHIPRVSISRFNPASNPFPNKNRWEVISKPITNLDAGTKVFIEGYGVMDLLRMKKEKRGYVVFWCADENGMVELEIAAKKEWCDEDGGQPTRLKKIVMLILPQLFKRANHWVPKIPDAVAKYLANSCKEQINNAWGGVLENQAFSVAGLSRIHSSYTATSLVILLQQNSVVDKRIKTPYLLLSLSARISCFNITVGRELASGEITSHASGSGGRARSIRAEFGRSNGSLLIHVRKNSGWRRRV